MALGMRQFVAYNLRKPEVTDRRGALRKAILGSCSKVSKEDKKN